MSSFLEIALPTDIAVQLNQEDFHPPKSDSSFKPSGVLDLMHRLGIYQRRPKEVNTETLAEYEWWIPDLARTLEVPNSTLYNWVKRGWLGYRKQLLPSRHKIEERVNSYCESNPSLSRQAF